MGGFRITLIGQRMVRTPVMVQKLKKFLAKLEEDLLHSLSTIPRHLNFIEHTSDIGWKEHQRARPIIIDPGLYSVHKSDVFWVTQKRSVPTAYKLFTGFAWMMLSRPSVEYCLWGWDNLPRIVYGGWLTQTNSNISKPKYAVRNTTDLRPGPGAERLKQLINGLLSAKDFKANLIKEHFSLSSILQNLRECEDDTELLQVVGYFIGVKLLLIQRGESAWTLGPQELICPLCESLEVYFSCFQYFLGPQELTKQRTWLIWKFRFPPTSIHSLNLLGLHGK